MCLPATLGGSEDEESAEPRITLVRARKRRSASGSGLIPALPVSCCVFCKTNVCFAKENVFLQKQICVYLQRSTPRALPLLRCLDLQNQMCVFKNQMCFSKKTKYEFTFRA